MELRWRTCITMRMRRPAQPFGYTCKDRLRSPTSTRGGYVRFTKNPGRLTGLLYLLVSIPGAFALVYVPSKVIVHGDATATANNIAASETLFRLGIAVQL